MRKHKIDEESYGVSQLIEFYAYSDAIVETVRQPLIVLDSSFHIKSANKAFYQTFQLSEKQVREKSFFFISNRHWDIPQLRSLFDRVLKSEQGVEDVEVTAAFAHIGQKTMMVNARMISLHDFPTQLILLAIEDVTDQRKKESELEVSEQKYKTLFETMTQGVVYRDRDGRIIAANPAAAKIYGLKLEDILGKKPTDPLWQRIKEDGSPFPPEEHPACVALKTGQRQETVVMGVSNQKTGQYRWISVNAVPQFRDGEKKPYQVYTTFTEITEQKRVEQNLLFLSKASKLLSSSLEYERVLKSVAEVAVDHIADWCAVYLLDEHKELRQVAFSHKCPKQKQWVEEVQRKYPPSRFSDRDVPHVIASGKSQLFKQLPATALKQMAHNTEHLRILREFNIHSVMIVPILDGDVAIGAISCITTGDSGRIYSSSDVAMAEELASRVSFAIKNAILYERSLKNEKVYDNLFHANVIGVIQASLDGQVFKANEEFLRIIGYTQKELEQGKVRWDQITPPEWQMVDKEAVREILSQGYVSPYEKEYICRDGTRVPVLVGAALINAKTTETIALVLDISERKKLEQRKDEFIGIASHELKTPLTTIKGYTQILEKKIRKGGDNELLEYVQKTDQYINKLNTLIADLLDVSKIQAGKLQLNFSEFSYAQLVQDVVESTQHLYSSHEINLDLQVDVSVRADRQRIEQVLANLLSNAMKYSPRAHTVQLTVMKDGEMVRTSVKDFGVGISLNEQRKIFQRFYRAQSIEKRFSGLGIGLHIAAEIIHRHRGEIWVHSEEGNGSTFSFTLPLSQG